MKFKEHKYDGKVSAIVTFFKQKKVEKDVINSIKPYVDETIIVKDKGGLAYQRNIGLKKAKHEYVLFCDGDILCTPQFIYQAKNHFASHDDTAVVGGIITTERETPVQDLMAFLQYNLFKRHYNPDKCFMVRRHVFISGARFSEESGDDKDFYKTVKIEFGCRVHRVDVKLLQLGDGGDGY